MEIREDGVSAKIGLFVFLAFLIVFTIAYFDSLAVLFRFWSGIEPTIYRYGFLVLACSLYLLYLKKDQIKASQFSPNYWALLPTVVFASGWFVATLAGVQTVQLALIPLLLLSAAIVVLGTNVLKFAFLPVVVLLFAIPMWWPLLPYLRDATTVVAELGLNVIGKPVFVEGYFLHLPAGTFFVDDGCAGLRFFLVTLILCFMSIDMYALSLRQSVFLLGVGMALALLANWVRVIIVVLIGDYTEMQHRLVSDHNDLGWAVYGILVLLPFFLTIHYFSKRPAQTEEAEIKSDHPGGIVVSTTSKSFINAVVISCLIFLSAPVASLIFEYAEFPSRQISTPMSVEPWQRFGDRLPSSTLLWQPAYVDSTAHLYSRYGNDSNSVHLQIINYANQRQGIELINVDNQIVDETSWSIVPDSEDQAVITVEADMTVSVNTLEVMSRRAGRTLVWYWYEVGSNRTNSSFSAKIYQLLSLFSLREDANLVSVSVECTSTCLDRNQVLEQFLSQNYLALKENL